MSASLIELLREARAVLETWRDVVPAVSLCADIDAALAQNGAEGALIDEGTGLESEVRAWREGYLQGVADERTSEANIGIAGFGAKVEPARQNPYRTPPSPQPAAPAVPDAAPTEAP